MDNLVNQIGAVIPPKYQSLLTLIVLLGMVLGRVYHAVRNGGGLVSIWRGLLFGTNTPKPVDPPASDGRVFDKLSVGLVTIGLVGLTGCAVFKENPQLAQRVQTAAKLAAYVGGSEYLRAHPETRPAFEIARAELARLETADAIDLATLFDIINRLPVKNLQSDRAQMLVAAGTILLSDYAGALPVDRLKELQPMAKAIREGLDLALKK